MIEDPFGRRLEKQIKEVIDKSLADLGQGHCLTYEDYKYQVGYLEGLRTAISIAQDIQDLFNKGI